ncbi:MAG: flavodoxin family protein [Dorea sp.]
MECIEKRILEAGLVVLLSPVYLNNVSGAMKTFLDRIGSWVHTLALSGKMGIVVTVTDQSGQEFVSYYLQKLLLRMGLYVVGRIRLWHWRNWIRGGSYRKNCIQYRKSIFLIRRTMYISTADS